VTEGCFTGRMLAVVATERKIKSLFVFFISLLVVAQHVLGNRVQIIRN